MTMEYKQSLTELDSILNYMDTELIKRIPRKLFIFIKQNMDTSYTPNISQDIPINEQILKNDTKVLLSLIYIDYLVDSDKKKELVEQDLLNKQKYEEKLREKYNSDNLFKDKEQTKNIEEKIVTEQIEMIEYKESKWYKKIFTMILRLLKKSN